MKISKKDFKELCKLLTDSNKLLKEQQKMIEKFLNKPDISISNILKDIYKEIHTNIINSIKEDKL